MSTPTPLFFLTLGALLALALDGWTAWQNSRSRFYAGTGARHRRPGPATPWHRRSDLDTFTRARPRPVSSIPRWDDMAVSTYLGPLIHPAAQLQAIDLSALRQLAAGPLVPLAVAA